MILEDESKKGLNAQILMTVCGTGEWNGPKAGDPDNFITIRAIPAFGGIDVSWTYPSVNPWAVAHGELYRGISPIWEHAFPLVVVAGNSYYDKVLTGTTYYYWIRLSSVNGTLGDEVGPASAMARPLIQDLITALTGYIDAGVLAQTLRADIDNVALNYQELLDEITARIENDLVLSVALGDIQNGLAEALAFINSEITTRIEGNTALIEQVQTVAALNETTAAALLVEQTARVDAVEAVATQITQAQVASGLNTAAIAEEITARLTASEATAGQIVAVETTLNGNLAVVELGLQSNITAVGDTVTEIGALWTAKVGVNGLIGGFGIYNDGREVQAGFDVDLFWIGRTSLEGRKPFIILNDEVFIDEAAINSLTFSKLRDEAGTFVVENGQLKASFINTNGMLIRDPSGNVIFGSGYGLDWSLVNGTGTPESYATNGATFGSNVYGQINSTNITTYIASAAIGRLQIGDAAIGSAQIENASIGNAKIGSAAVNTLQIAGNAVTVSQLYTGTSYGTLAFNVYSPLIDITVNPQGGGVIGVLVFTAYSVDVDCNGECYVLLNGSEVVRCLFGVSTGGGDTLFRLPVTVPFSGGGSTNMRIQAFAQSRPNMRNDGALLLGVNNVKLIVMSGKR